MSGAELNPVSDLAKCDECGQLNSIEALDYEPTKRVNLYEVPKGSAFEISQGPNKSLTIYYPPQGFHWMHFFFIPFTTVWVGFVGFWTFMAAKGSWIFALFSIPFWYAGMGMIRGIYLNIRTWEKLEIGRQYITHSIGTGSKGTKRQFAMSTVQDIGLRYYKKNKVGISKSFQSMRFDPKKVRTADQQPAILLEDEEVFFFERASDQEQDWVIALLNDVRYKLT